MPANSSKRPMTDGHDETGNETEGEDCFLHMRLRGISEDKAVTMMGFRRTGCRHPFRVILPAVEQKKSYFRVTRSWQEAEFFAPLHGLGAPRGTELSKAREQSGSLRYSRRRRTELPILRRLLRPRAIRARISSSRSVMPRPRCRSVFGAKGAGSALPPEAGPRTILTTIVSRLRVMRRPSPDSRQRAKEVAMSAP